MQPKEYWKNFDLNHELHIAGNFIYSAVKSLYGLKETGADYNDDIFKILYDLSVGIERLLKITIILLEHNDEVNQEDLEKSLITHSHSMLLARVEPKTGESFNSRQKQIIQLLSKFYNSYRYDRYILQSVTDREKEATLFTQFKGNEGDQRGIKAIQEICGTLYEVIKTKASSLNLYTYELRHGSPAQKIFLYKEFHLLHGDTAKKELLYIYDKE